tara:strand:- start:262 stop:912 length:651 start_codon:yes stop_codon:yes gene_type:complete
MKSTILKKRIFTSIFLLLLTFLIFKFDFVMVLSLLILGIFSILEFINLSKKIFKNSFYYYLFNFIFITFISVFSFLFFFFSNFHQLKFIILILLIGCVASDIGGYVFGKTFKGPKLTKLSPNKTIAGSIGSFLFSVTIISILFYYYTDIFNIKILFISFITSLACQLGDLFFSYLKRKAKLKDTGNFLPGHGGVLDRLDGIYFGIPLGFIALILFF